MSNRRYVKLERVTAPASEPVSLSEAKLYLRLDSAAEDQLVSDLIVAARMSAEKYLGLSLISQSWKLVYNDYLDSEVTLFMPPVVSVSSVVVISRNGSSQVVPPGNYYLNAAGNRLLFDSYVSGFSIEVNYNTGYGSSGQVPQPIKYGMLAHIALMYDERGNSGIPGQSVALYSPFREVVL